MVIDKAVKFLFAGQTDLFYFRFITSNKSRGVLAAILLAMIAWFSVGISTSVWGPWSVLMPFSFLLS